MGGDADDSSAAETSGSGNDSSAAEAGSTGDDSSAAEAGGFVDFRFVLERSHMRLNVAFAPTRC